MKEGPWFVREGFISPEVRDGAGRLIAALAIVRPVERQQSLASLIAGAPELLQVVTMAEECLRHVDCCFDEPDWRQSCRNIADNARALMAKLEGK